MKHRTLVTILLVVGVYLLSTGVSYSLFSGGKSATQAIPDVNTPKTTNDYEGLVFDDNGPKTEECPINGVKYSKQQRSWWENHRPLAVMIENHEDARPQSGISFADVTYEAVAEGGITRTMNVFYCQDAGIVGPVRSARTYFLDWASEYGKYPLYAHVGGANTPGPADALGQINDYGWGGYNDLNQFSIGFPVFKRDESRAGHPVATEHTVYSTTSKLWEVGKSRDLTQKDKDGAAWDEDFVPYKFTDEPGVSGRAASQTVHLEFWGGYRQYFVDWTYDTASNNYLRKNGGVVHADRNTNKQLSAKTVVVMMMQESPANDGYEDNAHRLYRDKGTGKAYVFMNGKEIAGNWKKATRTDRTIITDASGKEVVFNRGKIWFEILPLDGVMDAN
jgi:hypothetical protein